MLQTLLCMQYRGNISSRFSINSEASASELIENLEEKKERMLSCYLRLSSSLRMKMLSNTTLLSSEKFNLFVLSPREQIHRYIQPVNSTYVSIDLARSCRRRLYTYFLETYKQMETRFFTNRILQN